MKISGLSAPISEKPPKEGSPRAVFPAAEKTAAPDSAAFNSKLLKTENAPKAPAPFVQAALFKALGLPADRLSSAIVSFAQFFSLPLEPSALARIRREAAALPVQADMPEAADNAQKANAAGGFETAARGREVLALAALAAADKGVELSPAALAEYAAAIDGDSRGSGQGGGEDGGENAQSESRGRGGSSGEKRENPDTAEESAALSAGRLKELCGAAAENPLLDTLNRLPGKNGQRWLVFPLDFTENGARFRVTLRLLLDGQSAAGAYSPRRLSVEITKDSGGKLGENCWLFIMDREGARQGGGAPRNNGGAADFRVTLLVKPARGKRELKALAGALARCMELPADRISARNYGDSRAPDSREDAPLSVNQEA